MPQIPQALTATTTTQGVSDCDSMAKFAQTLSHLKYVKTILLVISKQRLN